MPTALPAPTGGELHFWDYDTNRWYPRHAEIIERLEALEGAVTGQTTTLEASINGLAAAIAAQTTAIETALGDQTTALQATITTELGDQTTALQATITTELGDQTTALQAAINALAAAITTELGDQTTAIEAALTGQTTAIETAITALEAAIIGKIGDLQGQTVVDPQDENIWGGGLGASYPPTIEGLILKMTALQGPPQTPRNSPVPYRTNLLQLSKLLGLPEEVAGDDPVDWWERLQTIFLGVDAFEDVAGFIARLLNTGANAATVGTTGATALGQWITSLTLVIIAWQLNNDAVKQISIRNRLEAIEAKLGDMTGVPADISQLVTNTSGLDGMPADISALVTNTTGVPGGLVDIAALVANTNDVPQAAGNLATIQGIVASLAIDVSDLQAKVAALVSQSQPSGTVGLYDVRSDLGAMTTYLELIRNHTLDTKGAMDVLVNDEHNPDRTNLYDLLQQLICTCQQLQQVVAINTSILGSLPSLIVLEGEASSSTAQPDHCQRVRWLVDKITEIFNWHSVRKGSMGGPRSHQFSGNSGVMWPEGFIQLYQLRIGVEMPQVLAEDIHRGLVDLGRSLGGNHLIEGAMRDFAATHTDGLICALFDAGTPADAMTAWSSYLDQATPAGVADVLRSAVWPALLNQLYDGHIPLDDAHSSYSNDCSNCNGGGVGQRSLCLDHEISFNWPGVLVNLDSRLFLCVNFLPYANDFSNGTETCPVGSTNSQGVIHPGIVGDAIYVLGNFTGYQIRVTQQPGIQFDVNANVRWVNDPLTVDDFANGTELPEGGAWATVGQTSHFCICMEWNPLWSDNLPAGTAPVIYLKPPS